MSQILEGLNPAQREAAGHIDGPVLVLAGAGSGKTKTLTHRIAYMLEQGIKPWNILALTFTNKAAEEMRHRIEQLVGPAAHDLWMSTFHSACVRILRRDIDMLGYPRAFNIYDTNDQVRLIRAILNEKNIDIKKNPPKSFVSKFDDVKRNPLNTDELADLIKEKYDTQTQQVFLEYQRRMQQNNVLDFNDLINFTIQVFQQFPDVLKRRQKQFQYLMVDEYQDTNASQYTLIRLLSAHSRNIMVVGDDDQSIYGFRGADIQNILRFQQDYAGSKVVRLERNYRSTKRILKAANAVVLNNSERMDKTMWTEAGSGEKLELMVGYNEWDEAEKIADSIKAQLRDGFRESDIAVIYRTNAQSSVFEQVFHKRRISHILVGAKKFFDRAEIRDLLSYLKLILNPCDEVSFFRAIAVPRRGIGPSTLNEISEISAQRHMGILDAADLWGGLKKGKARQACLDFCEFIYHARDCIFDGCSGSDLLNLIDERTGYSEDLKNEATDESKRKLENVQRLYEHVADISTSSSEENADPLLWLQEFLDNAALVAGDDDLPESAQEKVTLMTAHLSKGLEYPVVYVVGMNEGSFPHSLSTLDSEIEEERRLIYVAFTRAKKRLFLTRYRQKSLRRAPDAPVEDLMPSRFIKEIPFDVIKMNSSSKTAESATSRSERLGFGKGKPSFVRGNPNVSQSHSSYKRPTALPPGVQNAGRKPSFLNAAPRTTRIEQNNIPEPSGSYRTREPSSLEDFQAGVTVLHSKYGIGRIIGRTGHPSQLKLEVHFNQVGRKMLVAMHANLEIVLL